MWRLVLERARSQVKLSRLVHFDCAVGVAAPVQLPGVLKGPSTGNLLDGEDVLPSVGITLDEDLDALAQALIWIKCHRMEEPELCH